MRSFVVALVAGLLFGLGLTVSGMLNPAKVLAFLDIAGNWDPSLAFVMAGAIPVAAVGFALARRRRAPVYAAAYDPPTPTAVDARLVGGSVLFGVGWGLVGYCPGPAIAALGLQGWQTWLFAAAMVAGMGLFRIVQRAPASPIIGPSVV